MLTGGAAMAEILKINPQQPEPERMARAAASLWQGEVIAIPTDTFYGLAANPFDLSAVEKIFAIKGRDKSQPLLLLVDSLKMAAELAADLPGNFRSLAKRFWPGPLTIVVEAASKIPPLVTGHSGRIGLRLPSAPLAVALIKEAKFPLTATSANRAGERECTTAEQVHAQLGERLALIVDGGTCRAKSPSTVLDLGPDSWTILREGAVPRSAIETFFRTGS